MATLYTKTQIEKMSRELLEFACNDWCIEFDKNTKKSGMIKLLSNAIEEYHKKQNIKLYISKMLNESGLDDKAIKTLVFELHMELK